MKKSKIISLVLAATLVFGLTACGGGKDTEKDNGTSPADTSQTGSESGDAETPETVVVKVGVVGEDSAMWPPVIEALKAEGIEIELIKFSDYSLPNPAVDNGEIDLNAFGHYAYLNKEVDDFGYNIVAIGETYISPQNIYSENLTSLDELKEGDKVAIPNDPTNGGRALKVLETAGLIKVDPEKGFTPEVRDITENSLNLEIVEVDAAMVYSTLSDVAVGVINGNYALDAKLDPTEDALFVEQLASEGTDRNPFINVIVAHADKADDAIYKKVVDAYQSEAVEELFQTEYQGYYLAGWKY